MSTLVLSGGSLDGLAFLGVVKLLQEDGRLQGIRNYVGTSFGALICAYLVLGCGPDRALELTLRRVRELRGSANKFEALVRMYERMGAMDGDEISSCIRADLCDLSGGDSDITFMQLAKLTGKHLIVTGVNLSSATTAYFSITHTPHMPVWLALRISMSLPLIMPPIVHEGSVWADGGLFDHFPVDFDDVSRNLADGADVIAVTLDRARIPDAQDPKPHPKNVFDYLQLLVNASLERMNAPSATHLSRAGKGTTVIRIPVDSPMSIVPAFCMDTLTFRISDERAADLVRMGYDAALKTRRSSET